MKPAFSLAISTFLCATLLWGLTACGPKAFVPGRNVQTVSAAGYQTIPAKVDIVLGVDTAGNIANLFGALAPSFSNFVNGLEASKWDYRFVTLPVGTTNSGSTALGQFAVSHYDGYWNQFPGQWISPFPGAVPGPVSPLAIAMSSALFPSNYSGGSGVEPGLNSLTSFVNQPNVQANYLRPDAMLAVMMLSTGDDTPEGPADGSNPNWMPDYLGGFIPNPANQTPIANLYNIFLNAKGGNAAQFKFYSLVAQSTSCNGYYTRTGVRYAQMAQASGGLNLNICTNSMSSMLNAVKQSIVNTELPYRLHYVVLNAEPKPGTISMVATQSGNQNTYSDIGSANCATSNGFKYLGMVSNPVDTLEYIPNGTMSSPRSGIMIQLCGAARLEGNDTAEISFENAGSQAAQ